MDIRAQDLSIQWPLDPAGAMSPGLSPPCGFGRQQPLSHSLCQEGAGARVARLGLQLG